METQEKEAPKEVVVADGRHRRFNVGEFLPIKGVWFSVKSITDKELILEAKAFTAKGAAR